MKASTVTDGTWNQMLYRYNATGDLVSMTDWLGTTTFELDLLHQLTAATDHKSSRVEYTYDGVGNYTDGYIDELINAVSFP
jgi:YD repeat-containing protein